MRQLKRKSVVRMAPKVLIKISMQLNEHVCASVPIQLVR